MAMRDKKINPKSTMRDKNAWMIQDETVMLRSGPARASVALRGAEARSWRIGDADLLWTPDPAFWDATAPVLFPVCGWTRGGEVRIAGRAYPMGVHGFARFEDFAVVAQSLDGVSLALSDNARTRAQYPFRFTLRLDYRLAADRLRIEARIANEGQAAMPYAVGLHPGFRWPLSPGGSKAGSVVRFDRPERGQVPVIASGGLISPRLRRLPFADSRTLPLAEALFANEALCFLDAASAGLTWRDGCGRGLRVETENFRHVVLWSRPNAPFLSIESWTGYGDPEGFDGDLQQKPSMILLPPGAEGRHAATYVALGL